MGKCTKRVFNQRSDDLRALKARVDVYKFNGRDVSFTQGSFADGFYFHRVAAILRLSRMLGIGAGDSVHESSRTRLVRAR